MAAHPWPGSARDPLGGPAPNESEPWRVRAEAV
jgi:hypothetical protein